MRLVRSRWPGLASNTLTSWAPSGNGSGRSRTPFTTEDMVVVMAIPDASVRTVVRANARRWTSDRHDCMKATMVGSTRSFGDRLGRVYVGSDDTPFQPAALPCAVVSSQFASG